MRNLNGLLMPAKSYEITPKNLRQDSDESVPYDDRRNLTTSINTKSHNSLDFDSDNSDHQVIIKRKVVKAITRENSQKYIKARLKVVKKESKSPLIPH